MKKLTTKLIILIFIIITSNQLSAATNNTVIKNYTLRAFSILKISSAFQVEFINSNENKVTIEIDDDVVKNLSVTNANNELSIKLKDCNYCKTKTLKAKVYGNSLEKIYTSGASSFLSEYTFKEKKITIKTSGASKVEIKLETEKLNVDLSGASKLIIKGNTIKQTIDISGASNYNGKDCESKEATIDASGASKATIDCEDLLEVNASGASSIKYVSLPKNIKKSTSGASNIGLK